MRARRNTAQQVRRRGAFEVPILQPRPLLGQIDAETAAQPHLDAGVGQTAYRRLQDFHREQRQEHEYRRCYGGKRQPAARHVKGGRNEPFGRQNQQGAGGSSGGERRRCADHGGNRGVLEDDPKAAQQCVAPTGEALSMTGVVTHAGQNS